MTSVVPSADKDELVGYLTRKRKRGNSDDSDDDDNDDDDDDNVDTDEQNDEMVDTQRIGIDYMIKTISYQ